MEWRGGGSKTVRVARLHSQSKSISNIFIGTCQKSAGEEMFRPKGASYQVYGQPFPREICGLLKVKSAGNSQDLAGKAHMIMWWWKSGTSTRKTCAFSRPISPTDLSWTVLNTHCWQIIVRYTNNLCVHKRQGKTNICNECPCLWNKYSAASWFNVHRCPEPIEGVAGWNSWIWPASYSTCQTWQKHRLLLEICLDVLF